ncbi:Hypothetical predicted protein [Scomber scombrus]|uniref:Uncharacterized protein n=1 Tax=Scomber scombrus TaxID=13677 RepID=A0AAV1MYF8_SCOSC
MEKLSSLVTEDTSQTLQSSSLTVHFLFLPLFSFFAFTFIVRMQKLDCSVTLLSMLFKCSITLFLTLFCP